MDSSSDALSVILPLLAFLVIGSFSIALFAFWIWMLVDCAKYESDQGNNKLIWIIIIIFTQVIGALIYFFVQRSPRIKKSKESTIP